MIYLDNDRLSLAAGDPSVFLERKPYPWMALQGVLRDDGFRALCSDLPRLELFQPEFGKVRAHGQQSHNRYVLQYRPGLNGALPPAWRDFIAELRGPRYWTFLERIFGLGRSERFVLTMHWHFAPAGASVSPHVDASRKIGSHIFYLNTDQDWDSGWGGQTVVLDDGGRLSRRSSPSIDELPQVGASVLGNRSFILKRTDHSWHAVRPLACPPDRLRKVFIVVINRLNFQVLWRRVRGKDPDGYALGLR